MENRVTGPWRIHEEEVMTTPDDRDDQPLEDLETETVEDLEVDQGAEGVQGGLTTRTCIT